MKMIMQKEKTLININVYLITSLEQCKLNSTGRGELGNSSQENASYRGNIVV